MKPGRLPALRRAISATRRVDPRVILFESWHGAYNDNPRAISEELHRRSADFEHVWAVAPGAPDVPEWATAVEPESRGYLEALGRAGRVVTNNTMPGYFRKKTSTAYLQTWHGTPLKRIAFDIPGRSLANQPKYLRALRGDVAAWDYLVSPNPFSTEVFRRAFRFEGEILETGYPRNDLLSSPDRDGIRDRVRAALGIEAGARAILYAPTWRDDAAFSLELDIAGLLERLGDGHVLLLRAHELVARTVAAGPRPGLLDVSTYPDNRELYLAADVLITDYSSVMFDFAITGKPIVLFTYDLERYRDRLRGFYFDFEREAPGPLLATSAEVIEALGELEEVRLRYASAYETFRRRFCGLEDGRASERVIEAVFGKGAPVNGDLRVAAVLPAGGGLALLDGALAALRAQDRPLDEVIVVDDTPDGGLEAPDGVRLLRSGGRGPYAARNVGWRATEADVVLFCDLRSRPRPDWARRTAELFTDPTVAVAGSEVVIRGGPSLAARAGERHQFFTLRKYIDEPVYRPYFPTCNLAVRRADLEAVGGFEEIRSGADAILCWRILDRPGRRLATIREVLMEWVARDRIRDYLEQNYRYGKSHHALRMAWRAEGARQREPLSHLMVARRATGATVRSVAAALGGSTERKLELIRQWGWIAYELGLRVAVDRQALRRVVTR